MSDHNIIQLPDALERRAQKIEAALERRAHGRAEWIEGTIELAIELAGARADLPADQAFGEWFESRFHSSVIPRNERAILIRWGQEPDTIRPALERTDSQSIRMIERAHTPTLGKRLIKAAKEANAIARKEKPSPIRESAKVALRAHKAATGEYPTRLAAFEKYGVSSIVYERAIGEVTTEDKAAAPIPQFTKAQVRDLEAYRQELAASFEHAVRERVRETLNEILATRDAEDAAAIARANEVLAHQWIKPFTAGEYLGVILKALHNDTTTPELRDEAFKLVKSKELSLRLEGRIKPLSSFATPLPKTAKEWEAQKRKAALARKRKPAGAS